MGQSSSIPGRRSRRATSINATSTIPAPSEPLNPERPAHTPDDIDAIGTGAEIQPKNEAVERCNSTTQQDIIDSEGERAELDNQYPLSSSDRQLHQHTSDRPQRASTSSTSPFSAPSSSSGSSIALPEANSSSITPIRPLASALQPASEASTSSSSISTRSRSFLSKLRSRRLSRRTSSSQTASQVPEDTASEIAIPSTSKLTLEDTMKSEEPSEGAFVPLQMPMTPPEELDAMFEERQRARRMIEATLMSAESDMDRPLPSARSTAASQPFTVPITSAPFVPSTTSSDILAEERRLDFSSDLMAASPSRPSFPILPRPASEQAPYTQSSAPSGDLPQTPDRVYAVLPRRSRSSSPSVSTSTNIEPSAQPLAPSAIRSTSQNAPSSSSAIPAVPRHVLVQGLVTRAPAPSRRNPLEPRSRVSSTTSQASQESEVVATNDSGFWDELPGSDAMEVDSDEPDRDSEDEDWERAMSQLLNIRRDSPNAERPSASDPSDPEDDGLDGQANLIGRLLRIAAAATAATLLPGGLTVDGEVVPGFDDSGPLRALVGRGRSPSGQPASRTISSDVPTTASTTSTDNGTALVGADNGAALAVDSMNGNGAAPTETSNGVESSASISAPEAPVATSEAAVVSESPLPSSPPIPALAGLSSEAPSSYPSDLASPLESPVGPSSTAMDISPPPTPTTTLERTPNGILASPSGIASPALSRSENGMRLGNSVLPGILPLRASSGRLAPEGTFDRFLADLQRDVSSAIRSSVDRESSTTSVRTPAEPAAPAISTDTILNNASSTPETTAYTPEAQAARPFSFFRAYRFPPRPMPAAAGGGVPLSASTPATTAASAPTPAAAAPSDAEDMQIDQPASQTASQSITPAVTAVTIPNIVPMIFVGVRQAPASMLEDLPSSFGMAPSGARPGPTANDTAPVDVPSDIDMPDASSPTSPPDNASERQEPAASNAPGVHGFVLWIFGGLYPPTHPVVLAPSLLGDESMSYEEMMRLADMIGQHKPPTVSKEEISKAGLKTIKGDQVRTAEMEGNVRSITADRCLICLEDYEAEEDVRVLNCLHCFHQGCVDRWLSDGANTCPACRKAGVEKEPISNTQTGEVSAQADIAAETTATAQEVSHPM